jgi:sulfite exporter TauE/SafE
MIEILSSFFIGFVGSLHCLGMCGPLVMAYSLHLPSGDSSRTVPVKAVWSRGISHHLAFHAGRILTYGLLGALAATLAHLTAFNQVLGNLRGGFTLGAGALMVLLGLILLKVLPFPLLSLPSIGPNSFWGKIFPRLFQAQSLSSKLALGLATGFLPCLLSWALIVKAAATGNPFTGFLVTTAFGLGTVPALFLTGLSASLLSLRARFFGERIAAVSVILMGMILIFKGTKYFV